MNLLWPQNLLMPDKISTNIILSVTISAKKAARGTSIPVSGKLRLVVENDIVRFDLHIISPFHPQSDPGHRRK